MVSVPRVLLLTLLGFSTNSCATMRGRSALTSDVLFINDVRVFDPPSGTFSDPLDILVRGERIAAVGTLETPARGAVVLDAGGRFALPGLWDSHVHFSFLTLAGDTAVVRVLAAFVRNGITSVRDVGGHLDTIANMSRRVERGEVLGPRIFFSGPLVTKRPVLGALNEVNRLLPGMAEGIASPAGVDSILDLLAARGASMVKAIDYWDPILFRHLLQAAQVRSLRVVLDPGVPILNTIPIDTALALGVTSVEHAQAVWSGALRPELARERDSVLVAGITSGEPDLFLRRVMALGQGSVSQERLNLLADAWAKTGAYLSPTMQHAVDVAGNAPEDWRQAFVGRLAVNWLTVRVLASRGVKMLVGQDGFEPDGSLREMDLLASVGVSPAEILRGATIYPARWLGVDSVVGTLQEGKRADILILDANPLERITNIRSTWAVVSGGRMVSGSEKR